MVCRITIPGSQSPLILIRRCSHPESLIQIDKFNKRRITLKDWIGGKPGGGGGVCWLVGAQFDERCSKLFRYIWECRTKTVFCTEVI